MVRHFLVLPSLSLLGAAFLGTSFLLGTHFLAVRHRLPLLGAALAAADLAAYWLATAKNSQNAMTMNTSTDKPYEGRAPACLVVPPCGGGAPVAAGSACSETHTAGLAWPRDTD